MSRPCFSRLLGALFVVALASLASALAADAPDRLVSRPRAVAPKEKIVAAGTRITTAAGERRRIVLPDRTVVFLRERTSLAVRSDRVVLSAGEAFFETASGKLAPALRVETPKREVQARDSRFGVRVGEDGTVVLVAAGQARVTGIDAPVRAGQALAAKADTPAAAPRISHLVAWTRDLRSAAPLVPASEHAGGTLVARDPDGQEARLHMRRFKIDVHIEDGFARTTIDQTYFNHTQDRLEGTFRFPLPADASLSRLAMYVDGNLMEGGMVERDRARAVYERVVWEKRDPALLEWVDGSTFKMRVFPLEPRQEKRVLLSYTQRLPVLYGAVSYRFPAGHSFTQVGEWSLHIRVKGGARLGWQSESHKLAAARNGDDLLLDAVQRNARLDRDVVLQVSDEKNPSPNPSPKRGGEQETPAPPPRFGEGAGGRGASPAPPPRFGEGAGGRGVNAADVRFSSALLDGQKYLLVRYRPALEGAAQPERRDWVVLVETSGDRDPLLARTQIELVRSLLENAGREDTFTVVTAATRTRKLQAHPVLNESVAVGEAMADLEKAHLVGAFDFGRALNEVRELLEASKTPYLLHVGSGIAAMGEARTEELLKRIPKGTRYVGAGVGKRWNRAFMQAAAERTGGYFTQVNPDEPIAWRGMELAMTLNTPRLLNVGVSDPAGKVSFLPFVRMLGQGEELAAVALVKGDMPESIRITGMLDGKEVVREVAVKEVRDKASYLPRSWAKLEIDRLLAEDAAKHKDTIVALSKAMYVMTPFTSLLVLENEDMYTQYKVDRGRKDHWAMYPAPAKIKVVFEPVEGDAGDPKKGIKPSAKVVAQSICARGVPQVLRNGDAGATPSRPPWPVVAPLMSDYMGMGTAQQQVLIIGNDRTSPGLPGNILPIFHRSAGAFRQAREEDVLGRVLTSAGLEDGKPILLTHNVISSVKDLEKADFDDGSRVEATVRLRDVPDLPDPAPVHTAGNGNVTVISRERLNASLGFAYGIEPTNRPLALTLGGAAPGEGELPDGDFFTRLSKPRNGGSLLYTRPSFSNDDRLFYDLLAYAPGLNTSDADVRAVLEAEARASVSSQPGLISNSARFLIAKARGAGWQTLAMPGGLNTPAYRIAFDGSGRYAWERTLSCGLRERVVCDGKTLWHVYPELGMAARRTVSRFHRIAFAGSMPWVMPLPEDLARGADVVLLDDNTVAVIPHSSKDAKGKLVPHAQWQFVFRDGMLVERKLVEMPAKKVLYRNVLSAEGTVKVLDAAGKELHVFTGKMAAGRAPELTPDVTMLVVLDLPFRTPAHVMRTLKIDKKQPSEFTFDEARKMLSAYVASGAAPQAQQVFLQALAPHEQRQLGYYVLLAAAGVNLDSDNVDVLDAHPHEPLAHYLSLHSSPVLRKHASRWAAASNTWGEGMLHRLTLGHALCQRWASGKSLGTSAVQRKSERQRALAYVKQYKGTSLAWVLLGLVQDRTAEEKDKASAQTAYRELAAAYALFNETPGLSDHARYEQARCLAQAGEPAEARERFLALYKEAFTHGAIMTIDGDFRSALLTGKDDWTALLRRTAGALVKDNKRFAVLLLARQCWQLDDRALAQHLLDVAMHGVSTKGAKDLSIQQAALHFLMETDQTAAADQLVAKLLEEPDNARHPALWRIASQLAEKREMPARRLECLEKALELEFSHLPEVVNLNNVRSEYGALLDQYESLARAMATLRMPMPAGFRDKVVRVADRWRALDRDQEKAATAAASVLRTLGERELAWDYLTTPVALRPGESDVWINLAESLKRQGERDLADRAYQSAFERESTNAQVLWDRADNLKQAGRLVQAQSLYRRIAEGEWQPRFAALKTQARWVVEGR